MGRLVHWHDDSCWTVKKICFKDEHKHDRVSCWRNGSVICRNKEHKHNAKCELKYKRCKYQNGQEIKD
jgi:hypothetical protein